MMNNPSQPARINDILLGRFERPALLWLAGHMPAWVTPDGLTATGFGGALLIFLGYVLTNTSPAYLWLASAGFLLNWFGDSLDGTLARYRHVERPRYGFFVDHVIDSFVVVLVFLGIGLSPYVSLQVASFALIGYLLLSTYIFLSTSVSGVFRISYGHLGPTELRAIAIILNAFMYFFGSPTVTLPIGPVRLFDLAVILIAIGLFLIYVVASITQSIDLAKKESHLARKERELLPK